MQQKIPKTSDEIVADVNININNYIDTIYAIIGFARVYLCDITTLKPRQNVRTFQGRRLSVISSNPSGKSKPNDITPDLGIVIDDKKALLGEVKKNFPKDDGWASKIFEQLKKYDKPLTGWNTLTQTVQSQEIVLIVHQTTSNTAVDFYSKNSSIFAFTFPFSIVEFSVMSMSQEVFFVRTCLGTPTELGTPVLKAGASIPMQILTSEYSTVKLYDAPPPIPYLAGLIWVYVVTPKASDDPRYGVLKKRQKLSITLSIKDIVDALCVGFCFNSWHVSYPKYQPRVPKTNWVKDACKFIIACGDAGYEKESHETVVSFFFKRFDESIQDHFITKYAIIEAAKASAPMLDGFDKF